MLPTHHDIADLRRRFVASGGGRQCVSIFGHARASLRNERPPSFDRRRREALVGGVGRRDKGPPISPLLNRAIF